MQTLVSQSVHLRGKRLFLGLALVFLVTGFSLMIAYSSVIRPNVVYQESVNQAGANEAYYSSSFQAMKSDWIEFNLASTNKSSLSLYAEGLLVYTDDQRTQVGANYTGTVLINLTASYYFKLLNFAWHFDPYAFHATVIYDNNTFTGSFSLLTMPNYYPYLLTTGEALLAVSCGLFLIPTLAYLRFKARQFRMTQ